MRLKMVKTALVIALIAFGNYALGNETGPCGAIMAHLIQDYHSKVFEVYKKYGISISRVPIKTGHSDYFPEKRQYLIDKNLSPLQRRIMLEHEEVHFKTDSDIQKSPTPKNIAKGIQITRGEIPIHKDLDPSYAQNYRNDEPGSHYEESRFAFALARQIVEEYGDKLNEDLKLAAIVKELIDTAIDSQSQAFVFAKVIKEVTPGIIKAVKESQVINFGIKKFENPTPYYDVILHIKAQNEGPHLRVYIPLHETFLEPSNRIELNKKILAALSESLGYAAFYLNKEKELNKKLLQESVDSAE